MNEELSSSTTVVISDSDLEEKNIDEELEAVYYENSKLFSQIENEYLESIKEQTNAFSNSQQQNNLDYSSTSVTASSIGLFCINEPVILNKENNCISEKKGNKCIVEEKEINSIAKKEESNILSENKGDNRFIDLFSSSSPEEYTENNGATTPQHNLLHNNEYEIGNESQDFMTPLMTNQFAQSEYVLFDRYWYSDEELPPLESVFTLDKLKNTPSLAYMYDFFNSKISL